MSRIWAWRKNYRVWEANRKVFGYPENWIEPDPVLPGACRVALRHALVAVRARKVAGKGASVLFTGKNRTSRLLAGQALAAELGLDLYRIDVGDVVSNYIGETEKNLRRVFADAEKAGAVLLFDEADRLFGKRSDVRDSHERYANVGVDYLLQRIEDYEGLVILATNSRRGSDEASGPRIRVSMTAESTFRPDRMTPTLRPARSRRSKG